MMEPGTSTWLQQHFQSPGAGTRFHYYTIHATHYEVKIVSLKKSLHDYGL